MTVTTATVEADLLFPDAEIQTKKVRATRPKIVPLAGDYGLHVEIVHLAEEKGYRLRDLYYLAFRESGRFSYNELTDDQLNNIIKTLQKGEDLHVVRNLCNCGAVLRNYPHEQSCRWTKLIKLTDD